MAGRAFALSMFVSARLVSAWLVPARRASARFAFARFASTRFVFGVPGVIALCAALLPAAPSSSFAKNDARERYESARKEDSAATARIQMERIFAGSDDGDVAAEAGIWLGQYEYALGRLGDALDYFSRAESLAHDAAVVARASFWTEQVENIVTGTPAEGRGDASGSERGGTSGGSSDGDASRESGGGSGGGDDASDGGAGRDDGGEGRHEGRAASGRGSNATAEPGKRRATSAGSGPGESVEPAPFYHVLTELAEGDAETRSGELDAAMRTYLEAEGRARENGALGPLAYRAALIAERAREMEKGGKKDPIFDTAPIRSWDDILSLSPERGLVFAALRSNESIAPPSSKGGSEFASQVGSGGRVEAGSVESVKWGDGAEGILSEESVGRESSASREARAEVASRAQEELYVIQIAAYGDRERARMEMERLTSRGLSVRLERGFDGSGERVYRIRLGAASSRAEAEALAGRILDGLPYQLVRVEP
ncbi:MAG: SPOR domain-containing protein [Candidatus Eisenbacteria bacterium]|nr:SPOR domain-containing protein [Candidatus Eisenbacteria bacterium]